MNEQTPLTEAEGDLTKAIAHILNGRMATCRTRICVTDHVKVEHCPCLFVAGLIAAEARRQLGDPLQVWNAAIEAALECQPLTASDPSESRYQAGLFDGVISYGKAIAALQPPSSWPVSPLVEENKRLREALENMLIGANHLALYKTDRWPEPGSDHEHALRMLHATQEYDMWCCWNAAMINRAALANHEPREGGEL